MVNLNSIVYKSNLFGEIYMVASSDALLFLDTTVNELFFQAKISKNHPILELAGTQLDEYFKGARSQFSLPLAPMGTQFQKSAWQTLEKIPYGKVISYKDQAQIMGIPKGYRAVGGANGKNPIPIIIPCHRVVGSKGALTGFSNGIEMKIKLLKLEGHEIDEKNKIILRK